MPSYSQPRIYTQKADGAISKGQAVKIGSDLKHVAKATAATDKIIGVAQNDAVNAEDPVEVAMPGGGGLGKLGDTVAAGDLLTADGSGNLIATTTPGNRTIAAAQDGGVVGDLVALEIQVGLI